jgi:hypothetical protein
VRAVDVWFGMGWEAGQQRQVNAVLRSALRYLADPDARATSLAGDDAQEAYLALWAMAFEDAIQAVEPAAKLLSATAPELRFAGTAMLGRLGLVRSMTARVL